MFDCKRASNWVRCKLGDALSFEYGKALKKENRNEAGPFNVYGSSGIVGKHDEPLVDGPAVVVGRKGSVGSVFYSESGFWPIDTTYYVNPPEYFDAKFVAHYLGFLRLSELDTSTAVPGLNRDDAYRVQVGIPPINEQRRIVAKVEELFSELDKGVESLKTARAQLKTYRQSLLKAAFEGRLTEQWRRDNADQLETADQLLQRIREEREARYQKQLEDWKAAVAEWEMSGQLGRKPRKPRANKMVGIDLGDSLENVDGWLWKPLEEISGIIVDGAHKTPRYVDAGIPFISAKDIKDLRVDFSGTRFISQEEHEALIRRCHPSEGDVLVTKSGTIGRVAVVETDEQFSLFESVALVPVPKCMDSRFVAYACYFYINNGYAEKKQKGVAVRHLHLEDLRQLPIPVPPIQEQERLVRVIEVHITSTREVEKGIERELVRAEHLHQSILKRAFEGKLVPQDPDDEPAGVLLERIRQEQADTPKPGRRRRKAEASA
ncbi:restriction endonuclease subunit S [Halomonas sp. 11-S5]|uniref:restriction endonuclease subunit S n=1 Tax=Halomonas sp. 11-S5 TaxID=2994064 RepID=UPI002468CD46|nr:restriction endonuclease subunit S [Halomonas sp. 11-S5]